MKKSDSYLTSPTPPDDLEGLMEYIRPRTQEEIMETLIRGPVPIVRKKRQENALGLTDEEFAELALQESDLWDADELTRLLQAASGDGADVSDLVDEYASRPRARTKPIIPVARHEDELPSELDEGLEPLSFTQRSSEFRLPDLDQLKSLDDIGQWYKK